VHLCDSARMITKTEKFANEKLAVSVREAAALIGVSSRTVQNYISSKVLPARKIGRRTVILVRALEAFLRTDHASPIPTIQSEQRQ
jgi:excisionase family DNA binding protein